MTSSISLFSALTTAVSSFLSGSGVNLILGTVVFQDFEVPENIHAPGKQALKVHKLLGGNRQIDAMGPDPGLITWSGRFRGSTAESRAGTLKVLRDGGLPLSLTWNTFRYQVVIESFEVNYLNPFEIDYTIACEVLQDLSLPILASIPGLPLSIVNDISTGLTLSNSLGITSITDGMTSLQSTLNAGTLANASPATATAAQTSIAGVQTDVNGVITTNNAVLAPSAATTGLSGLTSGVSPAVGAASLVQSANASTTLGQALPLASVLGRMVTNVGSLGK